jgi:hypothetical protein
MRASSAAGEHAPAWIVLPFDSWKFTAILPEKFERLSFESF